MRWMVLGLFLLVGCAEEERVTTIKTCRQTMKFFREEKSQLCFASCGFNRTHTIAAVSCADVEQFLERADAAR